MKYYKGSLLESILDEKNIHLSIEKTLNDTQNIELKDLGEFSDFFISNSQGKRHVLVEKIKNRINMLLFENEEIKPTTKYNMIKKITNDEIITRPLNILSIEDEIALVSISNIFFRFYNYLIPRNSYANILDDFESMFFYKPYFYQYKKYMSVKFNLIEKKQYNQLLICDVRRYYEVIDFNKISHIFEELSSEDFGLNDKNTQKLIIDLYKRICVKGLPQGPIFAHFLGALLFYDLPSKFKEKFPEYDITYYVDDINIYYSSTNPKDEKNKIINFLEDYLGGKLSKYKLNEEENFINEYKTSNVDLKKNNYKYLILSKELSALNMIKSDAHKLGLSDKKGLIQQLNENLNELRNIFSIDKNECSYEITLIEKQYRFKKYREILLVNDRNELDKIIDILMKNDENKRLLSLKEESFDIINGGLIDKSFSNYIRAINSVLNDLNISKKTYYKNIISHIDIICRDNDVDKSIHNFYDKILRYHLRNKKSQFIESEVIAYNYEITSLLSDFKEIRNKINNINKPYFLYNLYYNGLDVKLNNINDIYHLKLEYKNVNNKNKTKIVRQNELGLLFFNNLKKLFNSFETKDSIIFTTNKNNSNLLLVEYRLLTYLIKNNDSIEIQLDNIIKILEEHEGDKELELVDPLVNEGIELAQSIGLSGDLLDNIIVTHHYIRDLWKNGSQDLYLYTLHNHEHSVELIKILKKLNIALQGKLFSNLNKYSMYVLIMAIYIHDLGMLYFDYDDLKNDSVCMESRKFELVMMKKINNIIIKYSSSTRGQIIQEIINLYKEHKNYRGNKVRNNHAFNSRKFSDDLEFITDKLLQVVLEVGNNHYIDYDKMYINKVKIFNSLIDTKYVSALLRLADTLDSSINRVSSNLYKYFENYIDGIDNLTLAHWAKHLLIKRIIFKKENKIVKIIIEFNKIPFETGKTHKQKKVRIKKDINREIRLSNTVLQTKNMFEIFINDFLYYIVYEASNFTRDFLKYEHNMELKVFYMETGISNLKKFEKYEEKLRDYLINSL